MPKKGTKNTDTGQVKQRKCATKPNPLCLSLDEYSIEVVVRNDRNQNSIFSHNLWNNTSSRINDEPTQPNERAEETCVIPYLKRLLATNQLIDY